MAASIFTMIWYYYQNGLTPWWLYKAVPAVLRYVSNVTKNLLLRYDIKFNTTLRKRKMLNGLLLLLLFGQKLD